MTQNSGRPAGVFLRPEPSETGSGTSGNVVGILEEQNDHKCHTLELPESQGITYPYISQIHQLLTANLNGHEVYLKY